MIDERGRSDACWRLTDILNDDLKFFELGVGVVVDESSRYFQIVRAHLVGVLSEDGEGV